MKTSKLFSENIKKGIITKDMLGSALYSVNKRAKNCRDREWAYKHNGYYYPNKYRYIDDYHEKKQKYYDYKDEMLKLVSPVCIHKQTITTWNGEQRYLYFLFYDFGYGHTFHHPIEEEELENYSNLHIVPIDSNFQTYGASVEGLVSVQFVEKIINLIRTGNYTYVA